MVIEEYRKLEHIINLIEKRFTIKKIEIIYISNGGEEKRLFLENNIDFLVSINELIEKLEISYYKIFFEKCFVSHYIYFEDKLSEIWNLGNVYVHSDYTLILSYDELIRELMDLNDFCARIEPFEHQKGYWD